MSRRSILRLAGDGRIRLAEADRVCRAMDVIGRQRRWVLRDRNVVGLRDAWGAVRRERLAVHTTKVGVGNPVDLRVLKIEILMLETSVVRAGIASTKHERQCGAREGRKRCPHVLVTHVSILKELASG